MGWTKRDRSNHTDLVRVRVFIDHLKFSRSWQIAHSGLVKRKLEKEDIENAQFESQEIRWDLLPQAIIDYLDEIDYIDQSDKELRSVDVYASVPTKNDARKNLFEKWLEESLDPLPGFQVHSFSKKSNESPLQCTKCGHPIATPEIEKGLKTKIACDMLSYAVKDLYDIGILIADDAELAPSVLSVQEIFDKKIIHIGIDGEGQVLRSAAWGHMLLDKVMREVLDSESFKRSKNRNR